MHTAQLKTPTLSINDCKFSQFLTQTQESLIQVETLNLWKIEKNPNVADGQGNLVRLGTDNGANIQISNSIFSNLRLCKGLLVYRPGPQLDDQQVLDYQVESNTPNSCINCKIVIYKTTFSQTNLKQNLLAIRPLYDYDLYSRLSQRLDSSGLSVGRITVPLFQNFGALLNVEDYQGPIEFSQCVITQNIITVPSFQFGINSTQAIQTQLDYYKDFVQNNYKTLVCDQQNNVLSQFMVQGVQNYEIDKLFTKLEHHSIIYISRPKFPIIFANNTFRENLALFGGAITINSPDFSTSSFSQSSNLRPFIVFFGNTFQQNMAYLSGSAVYVRMTRSANKKSQYCGLLTMIEDTYLNNFGTKLSDGTVSIQCDTVEDVKLKDYFQSSAFSDDGSISDIAPINRITDLQDSTKFYQPQRLRIYFKGVKFDSNFVGSRGSALYLKSVSATLDSCQIVRNGAVDSYQERRLLPPYTKYIKGTVGNSANALFTTIMGNPCSQYEFSQILQICQLSATGSLYESQLKGAVHYEGSGVEGVQGLQTVQESFQITNTNFQDNLVGLPLFQEDLSSGLYIKNARQVQISSTTFEQSPGLTFGDALVQQNAQSLYAYFPAGYFGSNLAPVIRIIYDSKAQKIDSTQLIRLTDCKFLNFRHFQQLNKLNGQSFSKEYEASLLVLKNQAEVQVSILLDRNTVQSNRVIGFASLFYFYRVSKVTVQNSQLQYNGKVSINNFTSLGNNPNLIPIQINLSQYNGIFQLISCGQFNPKLNTFQFNAAQNGAAFILNNTTLFSQENSFSYHIAQSGSIGQIFGEGQLQTISVSDSIAYTIGTAFTIQIQDDLHISQTTFRFLQSQNAASETVGIFYLSKVGAFCLWSCQISSDTPSKTNQLNAFKTNNQNVWNVVWDQNYLNTRLSTFNQNAAVLFAQNSYYSGSSNQMTFLSNTFQVSARTQPKAMWIIDTNIQNQVGVMSGVIYLQNSELYISTSDGSYQSPNLFSGRQLEASVTSIQNNLASVGAGVLLAIQGSKITMSGCNLVGNQGNAGGVIQVSSGSLNVTQSTIIRNRGNYGGFLYAQNSYFFIDKSIIQAQNAQQASFIYSVGFKPDQPKSYIGNVYINQNFATQNIITIVQGFLNLKDTLFSDNLSQGGSNGISAISSQINAANIVARQTQKQPDKNILAESGLIQLSYQSSLLLTDSTIQNCQGTIAGAIYVVGGSSLTIKNSEISKNQVLYGGIISVIRSLTTVIDSITMDQNTGGPSIELIGSDLNLTKSTISNNQNSHIKGQNSNIIVGFTTFLNGGSFDVLGGALYCDCPSMIVYSCIFTKNKAASGGAIYLIGGATGTQKIYQTDFNSNQAQQGGAIAVITANVLDIRGNNFDQNQANLIVPITIVSSNLPSSRAQGGGLYSLCQDSYKQNCQVLIRGNSFVGNSATNDGATFFYLNNPPSFDPNEPNIFKNNVAVYGANNGASSATQIQLISFTNNDPLQPNQTLNQLALNLQNFTVVSGVALSFLIGLYDSNNLLLQSENQATATFRVQAVSFNQTVSLFGFQAIANQGIFNFTGFTIATTPGTKFFLELIVSLPYTSNSNIAQNSISQLIVVTVRNCGAGEAYTINETCQVCPFGTYDLFARKQIHQCFQCESNSICLGKNVILPVQNFWRPTMTSTSFIRCLNNVACLKGDINNQLGVCQDNYSGPMCAICKQGFYSSGADHICKSCKNSSFVFPLIILCGSLLAILTVFLISVNSRFAKFDLNYSPAVLKIWIMHTQQVWFFWMIQRWSVNQSSLINIVIKVQTFLDLFLEQFTKCWLIQNGKVKEMILQLRFFWSFSPIFTFLIALTALYLLLFALKSKKLAFVLSINAFFIVIYISHMRSVFRLLNSFNCVNVAGQLLLEEDRAVVCYESNMHKKLIAFSVVSLFVWAFVLPLTQTIWIFVKRKSIYELLDNGWSAKNLTEEQLKSIKSTNIHFSVVVNGLRPDTFYWDQIIIFKNTGLCIIYVGFSVLFQGQQYIIMLALAIFMFLMLILELIVRPFEKQKLNFLQTTSTIAITGLFFAELMITVESTITISKVSIISLVATIFVLLPHLLFYFFVIKEFQHEITQWCFYRSTRLFKLVTFGLVSRLQYSQNLMRGLNKIELQSDQHLKETNQKLKKTINEENSDIIKLENIQVDLKNNNQQNLQEQDTSRVRLMPLQQQQAIDILEDSVNRDIEKQVQSLVQESSPGLLKQRSNSIRRTSNLFIARNLIKKLETEDENVLPELTQSNQDDDVIIGSVESGQDQEFKDQGQFEFPDEIFQIAQNDVQSSANVSISQIQIEEKKKTNEIQVQIRSSTIPHVSGVSSKTRNRAQGTIAVAARKMDFDSRPETQNSERTVSNNGQPSYITSEKAVKPSIPIQLLKRDPIEVNLFQQRIEQVENNDIYLPRFGTVDIRQQKDDIQNESQEGENVEPSPLKLKNALSFRDDNKPIRTNTGTAAATLGVKRPKI